MEFRQFSFDFRLLLTCGFAVWIGGAFGQFANVSEEWGVDQVTTGFHIFGHGVSVHDFDGDGLDDISFGTTEQVPQFYRNTGNGFVQVDFGLTSTENTVKSILWVDIDNDGDKDLFLSYENNFVRLYAQTAPLELTDITLQSGIAMEFGYRNAGAAFGDYNNDGYLDLYLCKYYNNQIFEGPEYENILYRNNGDNTFTNVTMSANASTGVNASFMPAWFDYNSDGWQDVFLVNDRILSPNHLLRNNGDGTFTEVGTSAGVNAAIDAMSFSLGDFNNDLLFDFFVANNQFLGNHLYRNNGNLTYTNIAESAGVIAFDLCWSGLWIDYDNNGWMDLHVATEFTGPENPPRNYFYVNNEDETFTESGVELGLALDNHSTYATAQGDWNMDGYPDFVSHSAAPHPSKLWENTGGDNNYFAVTLEGVVANRDAIGSTIYCYSGGMAQMRYTACGENFLGQDSQRKIFGVGQAETIDSLVVHWLSGNTDRLYALPVSQTVHVVEGSGLANTLSVSGPTTVCPGDTVWLDAGVWDAYLWNTGDTSRWLAATAPGSYSAVTQLGGIAVQSDTVDVHWFDPPLISTNVTDVLCFGGNDGSIELFNQGGTGLTDVVWTPKGSGEHLQNLVAGNYAFIYTDANGCSEQGEVNVGQPPPLFWAIDTMNQAVECPDGWFGSLSVTGGQPGYTADWIFLDAVTGDTTGVVVDTLAWCIGGVADIVANFLLTDANGCSFSGSILLPQINAVGLRLPLDNAAPIVYPNPAAHWVSVKSQRPVQGVLLFNALGQVVYRQHGLYRHQLSLDVSGFPPGGYWAVVHEVDGRRAIVRLSIVR